MVRIRSTFFLLLSLLTAFQGAAQINTSHHVTGRIAWAFDSPSPRSDCLDLLQRQIEASDRITWVSYEPTHPVIVRDLTKHHHSAGLYDGNYCTTCAKLYKHNSQVMPIKLGAYHSSGSRRWYVMHDKFAVFDFATAEVRGNESVVTGSFNWNKKAAELNYENIVSIRSRPIAAAYYREYSRIRDSGSSEVSDPVMDGDFTVAFNARCAEVLVQRIQSAKRSIRVAVWTISPSSSKHPNPVYDALTKAAASSISVRIITDKKKAEGRDYGSLAVRLADMKQGGDFHHKFIVVDDEYVVTGSFNYVTKAMVGNDENVLSIHNADAAKAFSEQWDLLWERFAPSSSLIYT